MLGKGYRYVVKKLQRNGYVCIVTTSHFCGDNSTMSYVTISRKTWHIANFINF